MTVMMDLGMPTADVPSFTLLTSSRPVPDTEQGDRWLNGFGYPAAGCTYTIRTTDPCDPARENVIVAPSTTLVERRARRYEPFAVEVTDQYTRFGGSFADEYDAVGGILESGTIKAVENEFWTGTLMPDNPHLASPDARNLTPAGGPVGLKYGMAMLEQELANCGVGTYGVIHMTRLAGALQGGKIEGDATKTALGNLIVPGIGYPGTAPNGTAPAAGRTWLYATGPVTVRLSDIQTVPGTVTTDTNNNTTSFRAQRFAAVTWDGCCHLAVEVTLPTSS